MISIITPFYNALDKIDALIASLQNQTCKDFEWIVIDDCSEENEFAGLKHKLKVLNLHPSIIQNKVNSGAGLSRNEGLNRAVGDYCVFVDSDDFISDDFVEKIICNLKGTNCDVFVFDYVRVFGDVRKYCKTIPSLKDGASSLKESLLNITSSVWCKAYKMSLIKNNNILFPQLIRFEDWVFNSLALLNAKKIYYKNISLYFYNDNPKSITHSYKENVYKYSLQALNLFKNKLIEYDKFLYEFLYLKFVLYVAAVNEVSKKNACEMDELWKCLKNEIPNLQKNPYFTNLSKSQRLVLMLARFRMWMLLKLFLNVVRRG